MDRREKKPDCECIAMPTGVIPAAAAAAAGAGDLTGVNPTAAPSEADAPVGVLGSLLLLLVAPSDMVMLVFESVFISV